MTGLGITDRVYTSGKKPERPMLRFGANPATAVAQKALGASIQDIAHVSTAERLFKIFGTWNKDARRGGMSMEDVAGRALNLFAISIPQGIWAIWADRHKWERNGQNILSFLLSIVMTVVFKNDKYGFNNVLDLVMKPKEKLGEKTGLFKRLVNKARLSVDYFDILKAAGVEFEEEDRKKAFWSKIEGNQRALIDGLHRDLRGKSANGVLTEVEEKTLAGLEKELRAGGLDAAKQALRKEMLGKLTRAEQKLLEALPAFRRRISFFPILSTGLIILATIYIMGVWSTQMIFKYIAPLDHDFDPTDMPGKKKDKNQEPGVKQIQQALPAAAGLLASTGLIAAAQKLSSVPRPISVIQPGSFLKISGGRKFITNGANRFAPNGGSRFTPGAAVPSPVGLMQAPPVPPVIRGGAAHV